MNDQQRAGGSWFEGQMVWITQGLFEGMVGEIERIDPEKSRAWVMIDFLGRPSTVELPLAYLKSQA